MTEPRWWRDLAEEYQAGGAHAFLLHGPVWDHQVPGLDTVAYLASRLGRHRVVVYDPATGLTFPRGEEDREAVLRLLGANRPGTVLPRGPEALALVAGAMQGEAKERLALVVAGMEFVAPADGRGRQSALLLARLGQDPSVGDRGHILVGLTEALEDLDPVVRRPSSRWYPIAVPLPDEAERLAYIRLWLQANPRADLGDLTPEDLARETAGLMRVQVLDILQRATRAPLSRSLVDERRRALVLQEYGEVLEVRRPRWTLEEVGGMPHLVDWLRRAVVRPLREGRRERVPMGVLLLGPAGTGKTFLAEALAGSAHLPFAILNPARVLGQYVGQSERQMEGALRAVDALAPCILFLDELDQAFRRGEAGDSGVSSRLFRRLLEWLGDPDRRGRVVVLGASNRPDLLDPALIRPGRFDVRVPVLIPGPEGRAQVLRVLCRRYGLEVAEEDLREVASALEWTPAEYEALVRKALEVVEDEGLPVAVALERAVRSVRPGTGAVREMTRMALEWASDLDLVPPEYRQERQEGAPALRGGREL